MLLLNLNTLSSIEIIEPKLVDDIFFREGKFVKLYKSEDTFRPMVDVHVYTNPRDIENLKIDHIIEGDRLYSKPIVTYKETDCKTRSQIFKSKDEFSEFYENKLKPYFDKFLVI